LSRTHSLPERKTGSNHEKKMKNRRKLEKIQILSKLEEINDYKFNYSK
jgi:hypothetical protein